MMKSKLFKPCLTFYLTKTSSFNKSMNKRSHNFIVYPSDEREFAQRIAPELKDGKKLNIFCSFTYITPNYSILFTLEELKKFVDTGNYKAFILIWDMNTLANPYFRKLQSLGKVKDADSFINEKIEELRTIARSMGFERENLHIYKSSDLWKRFISYKEEDVFQQFYSIL